MACSTCINNGIPAGCKKNGYCLTNGCNKLNVFNWLADIELPNFQEKFDIIEVRFKNTRKEFFKNKKGLSLYIGDIVVTESDKGFDVGTVSLTGELVKLQLKKKNIDYNNNTFKSILRKAKENDIKKWKKAKSIEKELLIKARKLAKDLNLQMKLNDVEVQGDKTKAIFYYTAEERVDFRELIKIYAKEFSLRIEMKQIGVRQDAGRIGGIGSCGRELCCSSWLTDFRSVSTTSARYQQLSINPLKLTGQCAKLKCCLNYELDMYLDALKNFPDPEIKLITKEGELQYIKANIFKDIVFYAFENELNKLFPLKVEKAKEIIEMNKKGIIPDNIKEFANDTIEEDISLFNNVVGQDDKSK